MQTQPKQTQNHEIVQQQSRIPVNSRNLPQPSQLNYAKAPPPLPSLASNVDQEFMQNKLSSRSGSSRADADGQSRRSGSTSLKHKDKKSKKHRKDKEKKKKHSRSRSRSREDRKKKKERERSRSREKARNRDRERERDRSKDRERQRERQRQRQRSRKKDRQSRKEDRKPKEEEKSKQRQIQRQRPNRDKSASQQLPTQIPMPPLQIPMPPIPSSSMRKRQRSRSPLSYYRRNQNNNQGQFWDSFSWIPRINYQPSVSSSALVNTKKMRRFMITNIPYQMGITEDDLRALITRFMRENYLKDEMNNCPVVNLQINQVDRNCAVELSSVQQTCRICKLDKIQLFKGCNNGIIRLGDSCYGNNIVTQAQTAAQAQAAAFAAINVLENKKTTFSLDASIAKAANLTSTLLRITNAVTSYMATHLSGEQWAQYEQDLLQGFSQYGTIIHHWFVKKGQGDVCADPGNLFIQYQSKEGAEKAMSEMQGRIFDQRAVKIFYVPRQIYYKNFKKGMPMPVLLNNGNGVLKLNGMGINSSTVTPA